MEFNFVQNSMLRLTNHSEQVNQRWSQHPKPPFLAIYICITTVPKLSKNCDQVICFGYFNAAVNAIAAENAALSSILAFARNKQKIHKYILKWNKIHLKVNPRKGQHLSLIGSILNVLQALEDILGKGAEIKGRSRGIEKAREFARS